MALNYQIRECYEQKFQSNEYNKSMAEIRKLSDFEIEKRQIQKFVSFFYQAINELKVEFNFVFQECLEKVL